MYKHTLFALFTALLVAVPALAQEPAEGFQTPPAAIKNLILAPGTPQFKMSPDKARYAVISYTDIPTIGEQAQPELRLAGVRVLASTNAPKMRTKIKGIEIQALPGKALPHGKVKGFPENVNILETSWSPAGDKMAALVENMDGVRLWIIDAATLTAGELTSCKLNLFFGTGMYAWAPDGKSILAPFIPQNRGTAPVESAGKAVPVIQTSEGAASPTRTYQDLLTDAFSELQFEYYATSQPGKVDVVTGKTEWIQEPAIYTGMSFSPDGAYVLLRNVAAPYSYVVPYRYFPSDTRVTALDGSYDKVLFSNGLIETDYINKNSTLPYARDFAWRQDKPSTLYWAEPLDGGNGRLAVEHRDKIMMQEIPAGAPEELIRTAYRFDALLWGDDQNAFVLMYDYATRMKKCVHVSPALKKELKEIYHISKENLYGDMGRIITVENASGGEIVYTADKYKTIWFSANGCSPEGAYPFISKYNLRNGKQSIVWQCTDPYYEKPVEYPDLSRGIFITRREANDEVPDYYLRGPGKKEPVRITRFTDPFPEMKGVTMQVVEYTRKDGVKLSGTLYLPAGYKKENGPLPLLMWAYPAEFKSRENAGQRSDAPNQFIRYTRASPVLFVAAGYAVLNNASFPIIGEKDREPNDTYIEQLVDNAAAAIDKVVEMGVADRKRIAVGGHSYGAFMTANLLANCDLFAAGIARSGAYNRTLTPFGFQNEMRTIWEVPEVYLEMSPFMKADRFNAPVLLIHGMADNNSGTFTMQSERLYSALKGNGAVARLVLLPYESHGYVAKESLLHQAWETWRWLEKYVKNR